jgi:hypothetical protein
MGSGSPTDLTLEDDLQEFINNSRTTVRAERGGTRRLSQR